MYRCASSKWTRMLVGICLLVGILFSCDRSHPPITPNYPVWLELSLHQERELLSPGGMKRFLSPRLSVERVGFGGVLVVRSLTEEVFYAYDLACPYENDPEVRLVEDDLYVRCPSCGSRFDVLSANGIPIEGQAKHPLRSYRANYKARERVLTITN